MVNPVATGLAAAPYALPAAEQPPSLPEPAVQVTEAGQVLNTGTSTTPRGREAVQGMDPLREALKALNSEMEPWSTGLRFDIDPEAGRLVVSIIDSDTGDVLRTIPTDAVIRVARMIAQLQGRNVDTKV
ncbi:flagellar protein FlaG [Pollutimonas harenae]|uniref:Flagellar protein FlaG n=1 Tax=Pollutimonas harenae TaxID=657015 RepID=A0A853GSW7_9BURK|nr:flagellar protein FlaG [Pollutimonas harenae]NYT86228.1 flagellar protein FlaG [Pollutimonas harenae]TEA71259.1 flagellar protein FlaG [Pollutimonas harenae]